MNADEMKPQKKIDRFQNNSISKLRTCTPTLNRSARGNLSVMGCSANLSYSPDSHALKAEGLPSGRAASSLGHDFSPMNHFDCPPDPTSKHQLHFHFRSAYFLSLTTILESGAFTRAAEPLIPSPCIFPSITKSKLPGIPRTLGTAASKFLTSTLALNASPLNSYVPW